MSTKKETWFNVDNPPAELETVLCCFPNQFGGFVYFVAKYCGPIYGFVPTSGHYAKPTLWCHISAPDN